MLCKECNQFLEISETIRSLGLNILKGVSEAYGNKAWMCFVVEVPIPVLIGFNIIVFYIKLLKIMECDDIL